jgi:PAS domain S-box-containing protein
MAASPALRSAVDTESFIIEYYAAWGGTDEDRIMSYYADNVTVQIPGSLMHGNSAVREQFVRPFVAAFPGNRHVVKNMILGLDAVVVEFTFEAIHKGPFAGHAPTDAHIELTGCGVYEWDPAKRQITSAHIYFDVGTLLKQIIDQRPPRPRSEEVAVIPIGAERRIAAHRAPMVEHLDLATVIEVSQTVSGEMVLEKLLDTLMRTAVDHAGAERALLMLARGREQRIAAEATTSDDTVMVHLCDEPVTGSLLPETVLRHVLHSRESVILDDASILNPFSTDPYIARRRARSVFCLPLMHQAKFIGVLYLENNRAPRVFAPARTAVLKLLASQAAISLENSRLYRDLADREGKIRRLVDANVLGICIWNLGGAIVAANEAFLRMLQYDRQDVVSGRLRWTDLTPTEWRERDERAVAELRSTGTFQPVEKEYFRKDGSRVPVLIGGALFEECGNDGVAFVLDLTERKRAEQEHEKLRQLESDLAHMNRLSIMGELAASLVHEVLHPIATARNNARAGTRFLEMSSPNLDEARAALGCVVRDVDRARDIVGRMRDHIKKTPPRREAFDLNEAVSEVIVMVRSAIAKNGIAVSTQLTHGLASVQGDRVQLQQVVMNLILNAVEAMNWVERGARELSIRIEQGEAGGVLVEVADSGPGIDPRNLEQIFEPFYTTKTSGVGMGLSICRSIIDGHGGRLWVTANEPQGAVFQFTLPGVQEDS